MSKTVQLPLLATPQQRLQLKALSARTRIPQQEFLREALDDLLRKYNKQQESLK